MKRKPNFKVTVDPSHGSPSQRRNWSKIITKQFNASFRPPGCRHKRSCDCTAVWLAKENAKAWVDLLKPQPWPNGAGATVRAVK